MDEFKTNHQRRGTWEDATFSKKIPLHSTKSRSFTELEPLGDDALSLHCNITSKENEVRKVKEEEWQSCRRRVMLVDAATQTRADAATQTDDFLDLQLCSPESMKKTTVAVTATTTTTSTSTSTSTRYSGESLSSMNNKQTQTLQEVEELLPPELDKARKLFSSINDLEEEIARLRFKAMSLQESSKWFAREKCPRPNRPVIEEEEGGGGEEEQSPKVVEEEDEEEGGEGEEEQVPNREKFSSFTMKKKSFHRSLSVPVKLVGAVHPPRVDFSHSAPLEGPDQSKFQEIKASSAFKGALPINQLKRLSKSLDTIPEMKLSFHHGRFYVQEGK